MSDRQRVLPLTDATRDWFPKYPKSNHDPSSHTKTEKASTHHTSVILEVQENTICSLPWLGLADNDGGHDLLSQLRLSLLDGGHNHISNTTSRQSIQTRTDTLDGDDVEISCTGVVAAVHDGTTVFLELAPRPAFLSHPIVHLENLVIADRRVKHTLEDPGSS